MADDRIAEIARQWQAELPGAICPKVELAGRLVMLGALLEARGRRVAEEMGLPVGGIDVLGALLRQGAPYQLTPTQLYQQLLLTSGTVTNRVDRLEAMNYVRRIPSGSDRRSMVVCLTDEGRQAAENAIRRLFDDARSVVDSLGEAEHLDQLNECLSRLLSAAGRSLAASAASG
jgi:DNA-binding MarR family transcriptional regulator